jgi:hypothetical protein
MDERLSTLASALASMAAGARTFLANSIRAQIAYYARAYRPEKYYTRGPGPKWREKHVSSS